MLKRPKPQGPRKLPGGKRKFPKGQLPKGPRIPKPARPKAPKPKRPKLPSRKLTPEQLDRLKKILGRPRPKKDREIGKRKMPRPKRERGMSDPIFRKAMNKGGFPDLSGDGKVTKKDILMGRGVIKKSLGGAVSMIGKKAGKTIGMGRGGKNFIKKKKLKRKK